MKALAIVALVFSGLSIFIPVQGVFVAMLCSVIAMITFRSQPTISGVTFGINIISTTFFSPILMMASNEIMKEASIDQTSSSVEDVHMFYISFHLTLLAIAIVWRLIRGVSKQTA